MRAASNYLGVIEQNLRLDEKFGGPLLSEIIAVEGRCREEMLRFLRENPQGSLAQAVENAIIKHMSMWPSVARFRAALTEGRRPSSIPQPPLKAAKTEAPKVDLKPNDKPPQKAVCQRYLQGLCRRANCKRTHPAGKFGSAKSA